MAKKKRVSPEVRIQKMIAKAEEMTKLAVATEKMQTARRKLDAAKAK